MYFYLSIFCYEAEEDTAFQYLI